MAPRTARYKILVLNEGDLLQRIVGHLDTFQIWCLLLINRAFFQVIADSESLILQNKLRFIPDWQPDDANAAGPSFNNLIVRRGSQFFLGRHFPSRFEVHVAGIPIFGVALPRKYLHVHFIARLDIQLSQTLANARLTIGPSPNLGRRMYISNDQGNIHVVVSHDKTVHQPGWVFATAKVRPRPVRMLYIFTQTLYLLAQMEVGRLRHRDGEILVLSKTMYPSELHEMIVEDPRVMLSEPNVYRIWPPGYHH